MLVLVEGDELTDNLLIITRETGPTHGAVVTQPLAGRLGDGSHHHVAGPGESEHDQAVQQHRQTLGRY